MATTTPTTTGRVPSDAPTALIGPNDYQNLYSANAKKKEPAIKTPSDAPTALIAPNDYQNLYVNKANEKTKPEKGKQRPDGGTPSDAPTILRRLDDDKQRKKKHSPVDETSTRDASYSCSTNNSDGKKVADKRKGQGRNRGAKKNTKSCCRCC